jgi:predicted ATPase
MGRLAHERSVGVPLVEREGEIAQLEALLEAAGSGAGRTTLVEAAAGLGKSRLLEELRARASHRGSKVLRARGSELEQEFSFGVVRQLFDGVSGEGPAGRILAGEEPAHAAHGPDEAFRSLHALYWLAAELATSHGPLLLSIDDVHWADEPSLRWLSFLARRVDELRILVVAAHRPLAPAAESPLIAGIASDPGTFVLRLRPLSEAAVGQLVRATLTPDADEAFCRACHYATGGNPLF